MVTDRFFHRKKKKRISDMKQSLGKYTGQTSGVKVYSGSIASQQTAENSVHFMGFTATGMVRA